MLKLMFVAAVAACVVWILMFRNQSAVASDSPRDSKHELKHGGRHTHL